MRGHGKQHVQAAHEFEDLFLKGHLLQELLAKLGKKLVDDDRLPDNGRVQIEDNVCDVDQQR